MNGTIKVKHLAKTFKKGNVKAVKDVSFEVNEGEFFAFLGPNGAGKSTVVQILTTLINPTGGEAFVAGCNVSKEPGKVRRHIGVALQETGVDPDLTGREMIELQAQIFGYPKQKAKERADELLKIVQLEESSVRRIGNYSGGMRRRLDLALTLVHEPKILFLDEPTTGLDPSNRKAIWKELERLNKENGTTVFLTTQYLEEADSLADRISIINDGLIVATGTPKELKAQIGNDLISLTFTKQEDVTRAKGALESELDMADLIVQEGHLNIYVNDGNKQLLQIVRVLDQHDLKIETTNLSSPTLDDIFLKITNEPIKEGSDSNG
ncbi:daunorubicin resistance protein DrrA family ABC transporter ATP-binding protein [Halobacillus andaensis]|uniref:Daunorubicin resistance protein DrrA family ABC transporter ATP-binding protein n=1 Tax=Halobacillus andaensis TaxID=1176239 RepID=A0A917EYQ8_HALAA|nr:ATP-binding cassette domain-containing protein [Halobacillus andaensis]MBP2006084.1 ABC-2 type transport system ATP-binding protein [Halobacillus andaensis]GGF23743.1 daunorubicin resistance protein DrrA family ABC transporter ATP-binding protein [Halobacillus andaensis]